MLRPVPRRNTVLMSLAALLFLVLAILLSPGGPLAHRRDAGRDLRSGEQRSGQDALSEASLARAVEAQGIRAYRRLWELEKDPGSHVAELAALAEREDGVGYFARLALARHYGQTGVFAESAGMYRMALYQRRIAEGKHLSQIREDLALVLERAGDRLGAFQESARLLPGAGAVEASRRLAPDAVALGRAFVSSRLFGEALDAVKAETSPASSLVRARALAGLSRNADAALEFSRYLAGEPDDRAARVDYALLLERLGRLSQALTEFEHLGRDGLFGRGRMLQALGRKQDAIEAYLASTSAEARRRAGVLLEELGEHTRSIEVFLALARESSNVSAEGALRALAICDRERDAGRAAEVGQYLSPGGAWLRGIEPVVKSVPETPVRQPPVLSLVRRIIGELGEEKGTQVARVEAELALRDAPDAEKLAIGEWFDSIGEYRLPIRIGTELLAKRPSRRVYALLYPKAFDRHVARAAVEFSTSPALILAVMREESHFDQAAVSWAGALGLMQIMPSTGQALALELGVPFSRNNLFDPATNIRFGACYLKQVLARFDGKAPWALASYNAGPGNADRWSASLGRGSNAHLVEAITFPETRAYVLRVLDSWMIYRWLYGG